jgi:hypothetical protein
VSNADQNKKVMGSLPSSGENRMAETAMYCGSAGGGVAIMLTPLYVPEELEEPLVALFWFAGMHSFL